MSGDTVNLKIVDPEQIDAARTMLRTIAQPPTTLLGLGASEYAITESGDGGFALTMTAAYQLQMQRQIVGQSIEVVRRRIDELGTREPTIEQQGDDRILVQVPGLKDPEELKRILSTTAKMTFRLVDSNANIQQAVQGRVPAEDELLYEQGSDRTADHALSRAAPRDGVGRPAAVARARASISAPASRSSISASTRVAPASSAMSPRSMSGGASPSCSTTR